MSTFAKALALIAILIAVFLVVKSGGNFNTIINAISAQTAKLVNQLQGQGQYNSSTA